MGLNFEIDPDIRKAWTLPAEIYHRPDIFELQKERLFPLTWQFVCDEKRISTAGQVLPWNLAGTPVIFTRDAENRLHALSNVCTHRGNVVIDGECHAQSLRCRYHGRRFGLDGKFLSMPEFEGARDFPSPADDLPRVSFGLWKRFLFAGVAPEIPFDEWIAPMSEMRVDDLVFDPSTSRDYLVNANWALYCDNYLEGFHIPFVHASLNEALDYGSYTTELFEHVVLQTGIAKPGEPAFEGTEVAAYYFWLFPATMFNFYPWGLSINVVQPLAPDRTRVSFLSFVGDASKREAGAGSGLDRVEREDESVVEGVQRGVRSRLYRRGRYSPTRETGVHHFHRLLEKYLVLD